MNIEQERIKQAAPATQSHINTGSGKKWRIAELAQLIADTPDYNGNIEFDTSKPGRAPRKFFNVAHSSDFGWDTKIQRRDSLAETYLWFLQSKKTYRRVSAKIGTFLPLPQNHLRYIK